MNRTAPPAVLYIDDDAGLRRLAARTLARHGYAVTVAEGGAEGVALARISDLQQGALQVFEVRLQFHKYLDRDLL